MPKDEFDFEDPLELNGMAFLTQEDTTDTMAETFIEEFMRLGYGPRQLLAVFQNPEHLGPNLALGKRGEPFIRDLIREVFARWGRPLVGSDADVFSSRAPEPPPILLMRDPAPPPPPPAIEGHDRPTDPLGAPIPLLVL